MMFQAVFEVTFPQFLLTNFNRVFVNKYVAIHFELHHIFSLFVNYILIRHTFCLFNAEFITFNAERNI